VQLPVSAIASSGDRHRTSKYTVSTKSLVTAVAVIGGFVIAKSPALRVKLRRSLSNGLHFLATVADPSPCPPPMWTEDEPEEKPAKRKKKISLEEFQKAIQEEETPEEE